MLSGTDGTQSGRYPAGAFGGAAAASQKYTVVVGATAVTSYDNATGRVRWQRPTGPVAQAWRTDGNWLYVAESPGGFVDSAPVSALRRIDLSTGAELVVRPLESLSFQGMLSAAFDGVVLFSSAAGVTAYNGSTGARLWSARGAVPEGTDHSPRRIYLTEGSNLVGVDPQTGRVKATASGSAVNGAAGVYVVRNGVALGLDQGRSGDAWGYALAVQRVTLAAARAALAALLRRPERRRRQRRPGRQPGDHRGLPAAGARPPAQPSTSAPPSGPPSAPPSGPPPAHILASPGPFHPSGIVRPCHAGPRRQHLVPAGPGPPGLPAARADRAQFVALPCSTYPAMP